MLHGATGGSPLFLREVVRELPADGLLRTVPVSATVRDHVASRFERLSDADAAILDAAAVLGADFEARVCAHVHRPTNARCSRCARPRRRPRHRRSGPRGRGTLRLHPRAFCERSATRRSRRAGACGLHHAAGTVLRAAGAPVTDLARHFYAAADLGDREDAYTYARRAGELARERFAFADAAVHFEQAAQLATRLPGLTDARSVRACHRAWRGAAPGRRPRPPGGAARRCGDRSAA